MLAEFGLSPAARSRVSATTRPRRTRSRTCEDSMAAETFLSEFLFRGRPGGEAAAASWHVILGQVV
ncbi:hypothetical protein, partial [Methylobacterium sp.]|uniref:hypothetical protein n=1 Tax=Methylobacterium sp. TaxID=409 RepID=UPI00338E944A